jgi:hypothetical protein
MKACFIGLIKRRGGGGDDTENSILSIFDINPLQLFRNFRLPGVHVIHQQFQKKGLRP